MNKVFAFLLSLFLLVALNACQTPLSHATYYIDYQQAGQGKVFITEANSVSFDYEPLGSILVEEIPGYVKVSVPTTEKERSMEDSLYGAGPATNTETTYSKATAQSALNYAASEAIRLGGDGIINLKLSTHTASQNKQIVTVSGMVIKRK